jgi:hypothetical protein
MGHSAMLVEIREGDNKGKWMYISKNGVTEDGKLPGWPESKKETEKEWRTNTRHRNHEQVFDSPQAFFDNQKEQLSEYNKLRKSGLSDKQIRENSKYKGITEYVMEGGNQRYEEGFEIKSDRKQDIAILKKGREENRKQYGFLANNCNDLVDDSIDKGKVWNPDTSLRPNEWFSEMKKHFSEKDKEYFNNHHYKAK